MKENSVLESSKENSLKRINNIWARLVKNKTMANFYTASMEKYVYLGHMTEVTIENTHKKISYYIPHHAVFIPEKMLCINQKRCPLPSP